MAQEPDHIHARQKLIPKSTAPGTDPCLFHPLFFKCIPPPKDQTDASAQDPQNSQGSIYPGPLLVSCPWDLCPDPGWAADPKLPSAIQLDLIPGSYDSFFPGLLRRLSFRSLCLIWRFRFRFSVIIRYRPFRFFRFSWFFWFFRLLSFILHDHPVYGPIL